MNRRYQDRPRSIAAALVALALVVSGCGSVTKTPRIPGIQSQPVSSSQLRLAADGAEVSTDGGATWTVSLPGAMSVVVAPSDPSIAYAGRTPGCAAGIQEPLYVTRDGGRTWAEVGPVGVQLFAVDPTDPNIVYGSACAGVTRTGDGAATWSELRGSQLPGYDVLAIAIAPGAPSVLYVAFVSEGGAVALRRSRDGGATFTDIGGGFQAPCRVQVSPTDPALIELVESGATYSSSDGGSTWSPAPP